MKKVVRPESPYGVCTTRSRPSFAFSASVMSSSKESARPMQFGALATPASLPRRVVTILESMCTRSLAGGKAISRPSSETRRSDSSSNMMSMTLPVLPRLRMWSTTSLWLSR